MNVWLIQTGEPLPFIQDTRKMRTAVVAEKLLERGHSVLWWTSAFDHLQKTWIFRHETDLEIKKGLRIKALKGIGYRKNVSLLRFIDHRIIARKFRNLACTMTRPDVVVASMPSHDLSYEAVVFSRRHGIPVLVDIRDPWPDIFLENVPDGLKGLARLILYQDFRFARETMKHADGLLAMMNALLEWGLKYAERERKKSDRVFYLGYRKFPAPGRKSEIIGEILDRMKGRFTVIFIGSFAIYHNPSILVEAAARLRKENIFFVLAGNGELFGEIREKTSAMENIITPGWLNQDEITVLLQHTHVGVCPATREAEFFPNKAFTYLSEGLPVLSAFRGDMKEIIEKYEIGFYYSPNDVDSLVSLIKRLSCNSVLYKRISENARMFFDGMGDADKIYSEYVRHIENVVKRHGERGIDGWN